MISHGEGYFGKVWSSQSDHSNQIKTAVTRAQNAWWIHGFTLPFITTSHTSINVSVSEIFLFFVFQLVVGITSITIHEVQLHGPFYGWIWVCRGQNMSLVHVLTFPGGFWCIRGTLSAVWMVLQILFLNILKVYFKCFVLLSMDPMLCLINETPE